MVELDVINKQNSVNIIIKDDDNNTDTNNSYYIFKKAQLGPNEANEPIGIIRFCSAIRTQDEDGMVSIKPIDGVTNEDLLEIVRDRLTSYNSKEAKQALIDVEEALLWLNKLSEDTVNKLKKLINEENIEYKGE